MINIEDYVQVIIQAIATIFGELISSCLGCISTILVGLFLNYLLHNYFINLEHRKAVEREKSLTLFEVVLDDTRKFIPVIRDLLTKYSAYFDLNYSKLGELCNDEFNADKFEAIDWEVPSSGTYVLRFNDVYARVNNVQHIKYEQWRWMSSPTWIHTSQTTNITEGDTNSHYVYYEIQGSGEF